MSELTVEEKAKKFYTQFFIEQHQKDIVSILKSNNNEASTTHLVYVDYMDFDSIESEHPVGFNNLLFNAILYFDWLQKSLQDAQKYFYDLLSDLDKDMKLKNKIYARIKSLPEDEKVNPQFPQCQHINNFICFNGTVTRAFQPIVLEYTQKYVCQNCGTEFTSHLDYGSKDLLIKPSSCPKEDCASTKFKSIDIDKDFRTKARDYQEIKVQEKLNFFSSSTVPRSLLVILEDDLVDKCKPGDDVTINGIIIQRYGRLTDNLRCDIELVMYANYVQINNEDQTHILITKEEEQGFQDFWQSYQRRPMTARNIILNSLCPQLYGMYIVKLAVTLVIVGGVPRKDANGSRSRGESHLLLVGDPGTGKSQFLKYAAKIVPRSIITTGIGSTSAGLTATASREGGSWHLEAGALVLADGGICCVDEFNCMKESDRSSMLEAMEQQSLSIAKAGMTCTLKTECSVLAASNPKGYYNSDLPVTVNIGMSAPLLSRFDLVLLLLDSPNEDWDRLAARFLLQGKDLLRKNSEEAKKVWSFEKLKVYLNYVKSFRPNLTPEANVILQTYYGLKREQDDRNAARTTPRMLESLIRLSQAHAKLMFRNEVLIVDVVVVITLFECSLDKRASFNSVNILHTAFPIDSEIEYINQVEIILKKLKLHDLMDREMDYVSRNYEPFCLDDNDDATEGSSSSDQNVNINSSQFNVISQMIGAIPTQEPINKFKRQTQAAAKCVMKLNDIKEVNENEEEENEGEEERVVQSNKTFNFSISSSNKRKLDKDFIMATINSDRENLDDENDENKCPDETFSKRQKLNNVDVHKEASQSSASQTTQLFKSQSQLKTEAELKSLLQSQQLNKARDLDDIDENLLNLDDME